MLHGARVFLAEDDIFTGLDLKAEIEAAGGRVIGPCPSVAAALVALETERVAAAILDANLADRDVTPVALLLLQRGLPVILHTGIGSPSALKRVYPDLPVLMKPVDPAVLVTALEREIARAAGAVMH